MPRLDKVLVPAAPDKDLNHAPPQHLEQPTQHLSHHNAIDPEDRQTGAPASTEFPIAQGPNVQLPHIRTTHYPPPFTRSLSNIITPSESRSEVGTNLERPRSASASLAPSLADSQSLSMSGSGVLGPKSYRYAPLKDLEFRLIRVLRARMSKLKCEIIHSSIEDAPEYTAISYAWGDGIDTRTLLLQGVNIPVAVSLHDALRAVRRREEDIFVWVDALCIDQQNKEEKNRQIRLMGQIYSRATSVAIWIGPEFENSELAVPLLQKVKDNTLDTQYLKAFHQNSDSLALFNLFKRDYWKRLWVVQEVTLAKAKWVYCGDSVFSWEVYRRVAEIFWDKESDPHIRQGPASFPELESLWQLGDESMLEVMRACRKKLSENARDKVFGVLGLLPEETRRGFSCDYSQTIKTVYMDVVDFLVSATHQLDVIRESIHFPLHVNSMGLPSWCPDWSHIPEVSGLTRTLNFAASRDANGPTKAKYRFHDERRKLEISAVTLDSVMATGVAVGTFCAAQDYLMAFLQWRAVLLHELKIEDGNESHPMHAAFCRTLCLGQIPEERNHPQVWRDLCFHVFASLIHERLPRLPIDEDLRHYADATGLIEPAARRKFLQDNFGNRMMGRSLCITDGGLIGMGSGYMTAGDVVVVPFGCSTPIILRPENRLGEYRYVGDIYIDGYMHGEAVAEMEAGNPKRVETKYKLC
ncbi:heterokaryon incompatibility protein-domain-containing protein [Paraphoma chrysanthemicola]|uniref:Heterokaryon incompatibility protein-domain-containing protein n=1 Tax=Paraphoma chrysanthemicola TaxID=798071 RepID=A0A8K0RDH1_9PLEO|nr:heterokaryon incompatibility protein-domain-containing protein [Paraphoma chrysanthemicola]